MSVYAATYGAVYPGGSPVAIAAWTVQADWNNDGVFTGTGEDISTRTLDTDTVTIQYGRDQARALSPIAPGVAAFLIDNVSRDYSPDNSGSAIAPNVLPARPVKITAVQNSTTYVMYLGFFDSYVVSSQDHTVAVGCVDALSRFSGVTLSTALLQGVSTGTAIGAVLDAVGWPGGARALDPGSTQIRWWWEEGTDALTALQKLIASEGPPSIAYVDAVTGNFVFRDRQHRLLRTASKTSQATWADSGTDAVPVFTAPFTYDLGWSGIVNSAMVSVDRRDAQGTLLVVWQLSSNGTDSSTIPGTSSDIIVIPASGTAVFAAQASGDPSTGAVVPVAGTDFTQVSGTATASLSRTSGQATTITLTDSGTGSVISGLQLRAYTVPVVQTSQISVSDATSVTAYGTRSLPDTAAPVWANANDALAIATGILAQRKNRLPVVSVTFAGGGNTVVLTQQLARDLSDRVTITEFETGLTSVDFYIEQIAHAVSNGGAWLVTTFSCEKAPATVQPFIFDDATWGQFDTGGALGI